MSQNYKAAPSVVHARQDKPGTDKEYWRPALKALSTEDFYGLVMVDQAGISRSRRRALAV
jgi:hypothetical protein